MYYLRLLMTEVAWTKDELREALDGEDWFSHYPAGALTKASDYPAVSFPSLWSPIA